MAKAPKPKGVAPAYDKKAVFEHFCAQLNGAMYALKLLEQFVDNDNEEDKAVMNKVAPVFFKVAEMALVDEAVSILSRITDKKFSMNDPANANITIDRIIEDWPIPDGDEKLGLEMFRSAFQSHIEKLAKIRNKSHAHLDIDVNVNNIPFVKLSYAALADIAQSLVVVATIISSYHKINYKFNHRLADGEIARLLDTLKRGAASEGAG